MLSLAGMLLSLILLMLLAYRGMSVIVIAPALAMLAVAFDGRLPLLATYTQIFMAGAGGFIAKYFPLFLLGAIFGKLIAQSGAAHALAGRIVDRLGPRHAITAVVLCCAVLTYGGVSVFVVVFTAYPLAAALFRQAQIPKRLIPASLALGSFTFAMTCLPGGLQIHNLMPMSYYATTAFAAPGIGLFAGAIMAVGGVMWLNRRAARARTAGEGYGGNHAQEPAARPEGPLMSLPVALAPILLAIALNFLFSQWVIPGWRIEQLAEPRFGSISLNAVAGSWSAILALLIACLFASLIYRRSLSNINQDLTRGAMDCLLPIFNTASEVGYGSTIAAMSGFSLVKSAIAAATGGNPLVGQSVAVNILCGITGSASGGLGIALEAMGKTFAAQAREAHIDPQLMHRIASISCCGLDTMPHNGAVITLLIVTGLTHRQSYFDIAVVSVFIPVATTILAVLAGMAAG